MKRKTVDCRVTVDGFIFFNLENNNSRQKGGYCYYSNHA